MSSARVTPPLLLGTDLVGTRASATRAELREAGDKTGRGDDLPLPPHVQVWEVVDPGTSQERRVPWLGELYPVQQA